MLFYFPPRYRKILFMAHKVHFAYCRQSDFFHILSFVLHIFFLQYLLPTIRVFDWTNFQGSINLTHKRTCTKWLFEWFIDIHAHVNFYFVTIRTFSSDSFGSTEKKSKKIAGHHSCQWPHFFWSTTTTPQMISFQFLWNAPKQWNFFTSFIICVCQLVVNAPSLIPMLLFGIIWKRYDLYCYKTISRRKKGKQTLLWVQTSGGKGVV